MSYIFGDNIVGTLVGDVLEIVGSGNMYDFTYSTSPIYEDTSIKTINMSSGITNIGRYAFSYCETLETVNVGVDVVTIRANAFQWLQGLKTVNIPAATISMDDVYSFGFSYNLENVNVDPANTVFLSENGILYDIANKKLLFCPYAKEGKITIKSDTLEIRDYGITECEKLTEVVLPEGLTTIGADVFYYSWRIKEINLPSTLTYIGDRALRTTDIKRAYLPDGLSYMGESVFIGCHSLEYARIPPLITVIPRQTFYNCENLKTVELHENITTIEEYFLYNSGVEKITLPNSISTMEVYAFRGSSLTEVTIPKGVTMLNQYCFSGCNALKRVIIPYTMTSFYSNSASYAFSGRPALEIISTDAEWTTIPSYFADQCYNLKIFRYTADNNPTVSWSALPSTLSNDFILVTPAANTNLITAFTNINSNITVVDDYQYRLYYKDPFGYHAVATLDDVGFRNYTEENYITDGEPLALSVNNLDMAVAGIVESGSNANGEYTKFADGTMECYGKKDLEFNRTRMLSRLITFPQAFVGGQPSVSLSFIHGERNFTAAIAWDGWTLGIQTLTTSAMEVRIWSTLASFVAGNTQPITWRAIGRWKA